MTLAFRWEICCMNDDDVTVLLPLPTTMLRMKIPSGHESYATYKLYCLKGDEKQPMVLPSSIMVS